MKDGDNRCVLLDMYGDGKKFNVPVWYPCGKCNKCERENKEEHK